MNRRKWTILSALLLILLLGGWALWAREDPQLAKVRALRQQIENEDLSREDRRALFGQMREAMEALPQETREALFAERRKVWEQRERERMREFFALPKAQQIAQIDKRLDEQKKRDQRRQAEGRGTGGGGPRGPGGNGGPPGGGFGGRGGDPSQRSKSYLDNSDPENRAQRGEYRRMMDDRRRQRGM